MGQTYNGMYHFCPHSFRLNSITWPKEKKKKLGNVVQLYIQKEREMVNR